ncbi:MAG: hypothetical protein WAW10_09365 [Gallionella sp.]
MMEPEKHFTTKNAEITKELQMWFVRQQDDSRFLSGTMLFFALFVAFVVQLRF